MYGSAAPYGQQGGVPPAHQGAGGAYGGYPPQAASGGGGGYPPQQSYAPTTGAAPAYGGYGAGAGGGAYDPGYGRDAAPAGGYGQAPAYGGGGQGYGGGGRFAAVRLRGLPFGVRDYEVAMFLGLDPIDILLGQRNGRATGEAIAVLAHPAELDAAMRKNKAYMGSRYIEVFEARKGDYYRMVAEFHNSSGGGGGGGVGGGEYGGRGRGGDRSPRDRSRSPLARGGGGGGVHALAGSSKILKMRGLPFSAGVDQILDFFDDPALALSAPPTEADVVIATGFDGRPTGMAFVEFETVDAAATALSKDRHLMGSRYIELFVSNEDERARFGNKGGR